MERQQSTSSSMEFLLLEEVQFLEVKDDSLFQWELVDVLDAHEDADSVLGAVGFGSWDSSISWPISSPSNGPINYNPDTADVEDRYLRDVDHDANRDCHFADDVDVDGESHECQLEDDGGKDDEDDDDGYDLNDELVPWNVSNKLERQRIRKLGKRVFSKMNNSKRSPYLFVRPGCVRGKHGLGLKHSF